MLGTSWQFHILIRLLYHVWYIVEVGEDEPFIKNGGLLVLSIDSIHDALHVFINGEFVGIRSSNIPEFRVCFLI